MGHISVLEDWVRHADDTVARCELARGLLAVASSPDDCSSHPWLAGALRHDWPMIRAMAERGQGLVRAGRPAELHPMAAMLGAAANQDLLPPSLGLLARLLCDLACSPYGRGYERAFHRCADWLRAELDRLHRPTYAPVPIPPFDSPWELVAWIDALPVDTRRFSRDFLSAWQRMSPALRALRSADPPDIETWDPVSPLLGESHDDADIDIDGELELPQSWRPSPELVRSAEPGTYGYSEPSAVGSLRRWSVASIQVLSPTVICGDIARLAHLAATGSEPERAAAIGAMLVAATGTAPGAISQIRWQDPDLEPAYPGSMTRDAQWLIRPPAATSGGISPRGPIWIPIPPTASRLLLQECSDFRSGACVLREITAASYGHCVGVQRVQMYWHTLMSALARAEPLGITLAQWVAGDALGLSAAALHYDQYDADRVARVLAAITHPWFCDSDRAPRAQQPNHRIGSSVRMDLPAIRAWHASLREVPENAPLELRLAYRLRNLVHGLVATIGHRPARSLGELSLQYIDIEDGISILHDKSVAPDWQCRPAAVPEPVRAELRAVLSDWAVVGERFPNSALGRAAEQALSGAGPLLWRITSVDSVSPYSLDDYLADLPPGLKPRNWARHGLNQGLIGRVSVALRSAQMGWHGDRGEVFADGSSWSIRRMAEAMEQPLTAHLRELGWAPIRAAAVRSQPALPLVLDWLHQEEAHHRAHRKHVQARRTSLAQSMATRARELRPLLAAMVDSECAGYRLTDSGHIATTAADTPMPLLLNTDQLRRWERTLAPGARVTADRVVARNMLHALVRAGRRAGIVDAAIPRRMAWVESTRPGPYHSGQIVASRAWRELEGWLASGPSLPADALTLIALVLHAGYPTVEHSLAIIAPGSSALPLHADTHADMLLVQPGVWPEPVHIDPPSLPRNQGSLALRGLAALYAARWYRRPVGLRPLSSILHDIHAALPEEHRKGTPDATVAQIMSLVRQQAALTEDGFARLISTGRLMQVCMSATDCAALIDDWPVRVEDDDVPSGESVLSAARTVRARMSTTAELMRLFAEANSDRARDEASESQRRAQLRAHLAGWVLATRRDPSPCDLMARFALGLLQDGGSRKSQLQISTIYSYLALVAPVGKMLSSRPLSRSSGVWTAAYARLVAMSPPQMRTRVGDALVRYHHVLGRYLDLPEVDWSVLPVDTSCAPPSDVGYARDGVYLAILERLGKDLVALDIAAAPAHDIHAARARILICELMLRGALRTIEAHALARADIQRVSKDDFTVTIKASSRSGLKTASARRQVSMLPSLSAIAAQVVADWIHDQGLRGSDEANRPLMQSVSRADYRRLDRNVSYRRIGELLRAGTGNPAAVQYWLRKTGIHRRVMAMRLSGKYTGWDLTDLLATVGHRAIDTTMSAYLHDPTLRLLGVASHARPSLSRIAVAAGIDVSGVSRLASGVRDSRQRMATVLAHLMRSNQSHAHDRCTVIAWPAMPLPTERAALTHADMDRLLRAYCAGTEMTDLTRACGLPSATAVHLDTILARWRDEYGICLGFDLEAPVQIHPPRPSRRLRSVWRAWVEAPRRPEILADIGRSCCIHWAYPMARRGIPGTAGQWAVWHPHLEQLPGASQWTERRVGALTIRRPTAQKNASSPWPQLRWAAMVACLLHEVGALNYKNNSKL